MNWITREHPKIDRIASPWLIKRFVDPDAQIFYVPFDQVKIKALELDTTPFDSLSSARIVFHLDILFRLCYGQISLKKTSNQFIKDGLLNERHRPPGFAWFDNDRRLCRNYELLMETAEEMVKLSAIKHLLSKI